MSVDTVTVDVATSNDGGTNWNWVLDITSNGDGVWTAEDLPLQNGVANEVRVKLTVNGEVKTTDGAAADADVNDYQTFTVTPGSM